MSAPGKLDLRGVPCPLNWAKTKVVLAGLAVGDVLEVTIDDPRGVRDLPRAAEAEGHQILESRPQDTAWVITIEK